MADETRQMLEDAARAVGAPIVKPENPYADKSHQLARAWEDGWQQRINIGAPGSPWSKAFADGSFAMQSSKWNPLTDDGDAFRLMVGLELQLRPDEHAPYAWVSRTTGMNGHMVNGLPTTITASEMVPYKGDGSAAAARLAIVRVAAEIGRRMRENAQ